MSVRREPVSSLALAEALITLSGFKPHEDIKIVEIGARPGEKLFEKLVVSEEEVAETTRPKIFMRIAQAALSRNPEPKNRRRLAEANFRVW